MRKKIYKRRWKIKNKKQAFKVAAQKLDNKVLLRIDSKTIIYIDADKDPVKARKEYLANLNLGNFTGFTNNFNKPVEED